jgi:hypothetical protein
MALIYTAYLDESGTHTGAPVMVMGGVLATARQWETFEGEFSRIKARYGFKVFRTKELKDRSGNFAGWTAEQCLALMTDMAAITSNAFTEGVAMMIDPSEFEQDYRAGEKPKKLRLDSLYGLAFRQCLIFFAREMAKRQHRRKYPPLYLVLESGHRNIGDAIRIFDETKKELDAGKFASLQTITVADKEQCDPLMMADFIASATYQLEGKAIAGRPRMGSPAPVPAPRQSCITQLQFKPGGLANIKESLVATILQGGVKRTSASSGEQSS